MSVRSVLAGVTLTATEIANADAKGGDALGDLNSALQAVADATNLLQAVVNQIGAGTNATTLAGQVTALNA